jgi:hypothetical protein
MATRSAWAGLNDRQLLEQCEVDTYRASGPGGQKRNKTSSAVRLRHRPSGLMVIAEESRSQHENRARALKRLRQRFYLKLREPFPPSAVGGELLAVLRARGLKLRPKEEAFWPAVGLALDALQVADGRASQAAESLGVSTSRLVSFLETDAKVWEQANLIRKEHGHKLLV